MLETDSSAENERLLARPSGRRTWAGAGACLLLSGIAFIWLDQGALAWQASWFSEETRQAAKLLSNFVEKETVVFCILAAVGLWGETRFGIAAAVACSSGVGIGTVVKRLVGRVRPDGSGRAFPSTHSVAAFAFAFVLAQRFPKLKPVFYAAAAAVSLSRISLEKHYLSDVLTGAALGLVGGLLGTLLANRARCTDRYAWPRVLALCLLVPIVLVLSTHRGTIRYNFLILGGGVLLVLLFQAILNWKGRRDRSVLMLGGPEPPEPQQGDG